MWGKAGKPDVRHARACGCITRLHTPRARRSGLHAKSQRNRQRDRGTQPAHQTHVTIQHPCVSLFESVGCDESTYAELLDVFLEDAPSRVTAIQAAVAAGDISTVAREAHSYRGAAAVLEATDVVSGAQRLEVLARDGRLDGASEIVERLAAESAALFDVIRRYRSAFLCAA